VVVALPVVSGVLLFLATGGDAVKRVNKGTMPASDVLGFLLGDGDNTIAGTDDGITCLDPLTGSHAAESAVGVKCRLVSVVDFRIGLSIRSMKCRIC
jgi:hypothetical protein